MREDVGLLAYSPLAQGYLSGKYQKGARPAGARTTLFNRGDRYQTPGAEEAIDDYLAVARDFGLDPRRWRSPICHQPALRDVEHHRRHDHGTARSRHRQPDGGDHAGDRGAARRGAPAARQSLPVTGSAARDREALYTPAANRNARLVLNSHLEDADAASLHCPRGSGGARRAARRSCAAACRARAGSIPTSTM